MTVSVAEYLGVNTFQDKKQILPIKNLKATKPSRQCPFKYGHCDKLKKGLQPENKIILFGLPVNTDFVRL